MNKDMSTALFCDCETDADRAEFFASGRAVETGVIAPSIAAEVAQAFAAHAQLAEKERECERLRSAAVLLNVAIDDFLNDRRHDRIEARRLMGEIYINSICYRQKEVRRALEKVDNGNSGKDS